MLGRNQISHVLVLLLLAGVLSASASAQTTGGIVGTVRDQSGAVIAGAKVVAQNSAIGYQRVVNSGGSGAFALSLLPPGNYETKIEATGFRTLIFPSVHVVVTETTSINAALAIGPVTDAITVTAAQLLQKEGPQLGRVVDRSVATHLPLATRNFTQILTLSPGTTTFLPDSTAVGRNTQIISVNGTRMSQNNVQINGADVNTLGTNGPILLPVPAPETIQEFKVQTALYDAAFGRSAGGNIQVLTRNGTNDVHGAAYEYLRNDAFNANSSFLKAAGVRRPVLQRNVFGATLGGPVRKNKAFFFVSYQGTRERNGASIVSSISSNVLIAPGLTDDRSEGALLNTFKPRLPSGQLAMSVDRSALALLNAKLPTGQFLIPTPRGDGHYTGSAISQFREDQVNANFDYRIRSSNSLSVKVFVGNSPQYLALSSFRGAGANVPGFGSDQIANNRLIVVQDVHSFSTTLLNEARIGYSLNRNNTTPEEPVRDSDLGIARVNARQFPGLAMIRIAPATGGVIIGTAPNASGHAAPSTTTLADTVSFAHGAHALRFGAEYRYNLINFAIPQFPYGQIDFQSFNDFLLGTSSRSTLGGGIAERAWRASDYNLFVQDDWRLASNLTVNAGLRYELDLPVYDTRGRLATFDPHLYQPRLLSQNGVPVGPPVAGFVQPSNIDPRLSVPGTTKVDKRVVTSIDPHNFAPRLGFAWSPQPRSVIRAGYGIFFSRPSFQYASMTTTLPPLYVVDVRTAAPLANPFFSLPPKDQFPVFLTGVALNGNAFDRNLHTPYFQQFDLTLQRELGAKVLLEIAYVGTRGVNLMRQVLINQAPLASVKSPIINAVTGAAITTNTPANASLRAPLQGVEISGFNQNQFTAQSTYHSLQVTVARQLSSGLEFLAAYTYAKSIDNASGTGGGAGVVGVINSSAVGDTVGILGDQLNPRSNRGLSDFDRKHRLVVSYLWDLPHSTFVERYRASKFVLSNWSVSGIVTAMSGLPSDIVDSNAGSLYGLAGASTPLARPSFAPGFSNCSAATHNIPAGYYFNPLIFARPLVAAGQPIPSSAASAIAGAPGTDIGNVGRNCLRGPRQSNVDFAVTKKFLLTESRNVEFRAEFFNLLNQVNLANPVSNLNAAISSGGKLDANTGQVLSPGDFGRIVSTSNNPRLIQFMLKFNF